jgi:response regulator RpfG family c-di-GMP phosphodiesterase
MTQERQPVPILFVDDEENILNAVRRLMMDEPLEILTAQSGSAGLDALQQRPEIGVIVSDQRMPGMSGAEFLEKAREVVPDAVRIVLTGYADIKAAVDAINKGGVYRYVGKPWNDDELVSIVREAAARYALVRENKRLTETVRRQNDVLKNFNDRLKRNFREIIESLAGLLELRDRTSMKHSRNVSEMAVRGAGAMGLQAADVELIAIASLLHDIGKIGMADLLLLKNPDEMTAEELKDYLLHAVRGQTAIDNIEDLRPAGLFIRHHHESYDGTGHPDGLKGADIPLGSRIIAVADYFDRVFMRASGPQALETALRKVRSESGKKLDPDICGILMDPLREKYAATVPRTGTIELEIPLKDLTAGMEISRDIRSGTGIMLLSKGAVLDAKNISALKRYEQVDPAGNGVYVWSKK